MTELLFAEGPDDPRIFDIDDDFRDILIELSALTVASATRRDRFFHATGACVGGTLRIAPSAGMPAQEFFRAGREFPVIARFSNSVGTDDVSPTVRGLTLRLLERSDDTSGLLDLTFNTGECFFAPTAEVFQRAFASPEERRALIARQPRTREVIWDNIREAASYEAYDFHSQVPQGFRTEDGVTRLARYRVRPAERPVEAPRYDHGDALWPPDAPNEIGRTGDDERPEAVLRDEMRARVAGAGIVMSLQVQLRTLAGDAAYDAEAFDASRPWPEDESPWLDLGEIRLDQAVVDEEEVGRLRFDPALAPPGLGIALSRSPRSTLSVNHLRALIYRAAAHARREERAPVELSALVRPSAAAPKKNVRTVCVIGAGPAGLTAAYELERAGHRVIVLEAAASVGGKCASIETDGLPFDLGGHICTNRYERTAALITELGLATEPITPIRVLDAATGEVGAQGTAFFRRGVYQRYTRLRDREFPRIAEPGLAHSAAALAEPLSVWLDRHDLWPLAETFGLGYTAAGYGYLADDLPALYFVKYVEMTGLLGGRDGLLGHPGAFTVSGGFASLWQTMAARLTDPVRVGVTVREVERRADSVLIRADGMEFEVDDLVLAVPLNDALPFLDATDDERDLADRIQYQAYDTSVLSAQGLPRNGFYFAGQHADDPGQRGHYVALHHRHEASDVYTAYSYRDPEHDDAELDCLLRADVERLGGTPGEIHLRRSWRFMPYFGAEDVRAIERLEAMQGARRTYYVGGLPAFELVECVVAQASELVSKYFAGAETGRSGSEILRWMVDQIASELGSDPTTIDTKGPLADLGLDSLTVATLQAGLSEHLGFRIPHTLFLEQPTLAAAARELADAAGDGVAAVRDERTRPPSPYLLTLTPARPFFCVGGLGASARYLRQLAHALGEFTPCHALELPGLDGRTPVLDDADMIAKLFVEEIRRVQPYGPYRLGGHSSGGVLAHETARLLRAAGERVAPLILLDAHTPLDDLAPPAEDDLIALEELLLLRHLWCEPDRPCTCAVDRSRPLTHQGPEIAATLGAPDPEHAEEFLLRTLEVYQAGLRAVTGHRVAASDLDLVLIKPAEGFGTEMTRQPRRLLNLEAPRNGWEDAETGSLTVVPVGGGHMSMLTPPHVDRVSEAIFEAWREKT